MDHINAGSRRTRMAIAGARESQAMAATLGREVDRTRRMRHLTLQQLAGRVGLQRTRVAEILGGRGATASLGTWVGLGIAIDRPLAVTLSRAIETSDLQDAGHLAAQEHILWLARCNKR